MFYPMKRKNQALSPEDCAAILDAATSGVLALQSPDGYPYAVPMSFAYREGRLYFHGGRSGHRSQCVDHCHKACFTVVDRDRVLPEEYTTDYRSVMAFGTIRKSADDAERREAIRLIGRRYFPGDTAAHLEAIIDKEFLPMEIYVLDIEHMTGKAARI